MMTAFATEVFELKEPMKVFCVTANSFPEGAYKAHQTLHTLAPPEPGREYFGLSWGGPTITYKAGATELKEGELQNKGLEEFAIRKGKYVSALCADFDQIQECIQQLIRDERIDPQGYCVEMYLEDNPIKVRCMVTMKE